MHVKVIEAALHVRHRLEFCTRASHPHPLRAASKAYYLAANEQIPLVERYGSIVVKQLASSVQVMIFREYS